MTDSGQSDSGPRGWFWPTGARRCHFDGGDGRALCGKWARFNPFAGASGAAPIQAPIDAGASSDDCATCRRKVDDLLAAGAER